MHKFFTPAELFSEKEAIIQGEDVKHIYKVLRLKEGQEIIVNNLHGEEYSGVIEEITKSEVRVSLKEKLERNNESPLEIFLFQGMPKAAKMDLIVQKGTELGIKEITPVVTERVDVKLKGDFKKLDRLERIALEACKQCKRTLIPKINIPISFSELITALKDMDLVVVPYENAENFGIKSLIKSIDGKIKTVAVIIGPEGGFEDSEINRLKENGAYIVTLGPRILRTETAGFTASSLLQYELGDLGGII